MKGRHHLLVQSAHLKYEFEIIRNITLIQGDSATGKTTLADMIREYNLNGSDTGINISCNVPVVVLEGNNWKDQLSLIKGSIVFIDEGNRFVSSNEFAEEIRHSDNYYCIITRESLMSLPYSITEIYGIHSSGRYNSLSPVYHSLYRIYSGGETGIMTFNQDKNLNNNDEPLSEIPDVVITEDSNSGFEFFDNLFAESKCISAEGKDKIFDLLTDGNITGSVLVIADGAAFGSQMARMYDLIEHRNNTKLYLPESFEWIILDSDILDDPDVRKIMSDPEDNIDSKLFFSWERFFTHVLIEKSDKTYLKYSKNRLNPVYLNEKVLKKIISKMPFSV